MASINDILVRMGYKGIHCGELMQLWADKLDEMRRPDLKVAALTRGEAAAPS
jgi:hypothetical protein